MKRRGVVALVLHAHLPFVRHPEHRDFLEERWLFEAIAECYLPLVAMLDRLADEGIHSPLTVSLSPPLVAMLRDELLCARFERHLARIDLLLERERSRFAGDASMAPLVAWYAARQSTLWDTWSRVRGDVPAALGRLASAGAIELWTCAATHAFLPGLVHHPALVRAQIALGASSFATAFGHAPRGIWLPECGYTPSIGGVLRRYGLNVTALESHAIFHADPTPPGGTSAPLRTPDGLVCFGRDREASQRVWSKDAGYPGDGAYREFYRDAGYERPDDDVRDFVAADGTRTATGLKYHRITDRHGDHKALYDPVAAERRAREHARDFVAHQHARLLAMPSPDGVPAVCFAPYDAELFGHWWFEGPVFLEHVLRILASDDAIGATTPMRHVDAYGVGDVAVPESSTWGAGGYSHVWLDAATSWMLPHVDRACSEVVAIVRHHRHATGWHGRAVRQAVREVLLLLSSDWAFLITMGTAVDYARARFETHLARFRRLGAMLYENVCDETWLADVEARDNFPADVPLDWADDAA